MFGNIFQPFGMNTVFGRVINVKVWNQVLVSSDNFILVSSDNKILIGRA